jgi:hypothetical protein
MPDKNNQIEKNKKILIINKKKLPVFYRYSICKYHSTNNILKLNDSTLHNTKYYIACQFYKHIANIEYNK